ncbi:alpha/beta fold hydrolase [Amycolatopsis suaedae]|uniref:Alpha/beta fold hydrolase n=1 Tax=Amycolatopsis suaedae TaxID=2510978 RepID=A0A4Q7J8P4_9PSEU|nr:alpha/beta fold hydrolase [Amycolatopsis suaedae]RZQ62484.1 alpha/beta fold hydrolase [Amycolatopsis suaedae]
MRRRMPVPGGELAYEVRGTGSPVVFLHAGALSGGMWDREMDVHAAEHTVIRFDARGHGESSTPTEPFANYTDLAHLLDGLGLESVTLAGVSQGSRTSIDFALSHPERVDAMLLAGPGISGMVNRDPYILDHLARIRAATSTAEAVECLLRMWTDGPRRTPDQVDPRVRELAGRLHTASLERHGPTGFVHAIDIGAIDRVGELRGRVSVLVGDLDSGDIHDVADLVTNSVSGARREVVAGAGHLLNLEAPEAFDAALRALF